MNSTIPELLHFTMPHKFYYRFNKELLFNYNIEIIQILTNLIFV